ncbi:alanine acetyltransferase [Chlorella sorokiniana]|uniref:Alanine acetyltransferase n=1 Tax=Chlorella sorokiniana TaxID=3076 RepID=A0A2P6TF14_CHLSO|nr:alanine acetyltransferase [Chlorella sorokiniana]|eukprot:PRW32562.1 alanine acetyltransferase [Chlorella sorokiniana]
MDTELAKPPRSVHMMLKDKAAWVELQIGPEDEQFDGYPDLGIEEWHKKHGLLVE